MDERTQTTGTPEEPSAAISAGVGSSARGLTGTANQRGLECPRCGCRHFHVLYTRAAIGGRILRRRECRHCARRLTTYEKAGG